MKHKRRTSEIFWGVGFILAAVLIILHTLGVTAIITTAIGEVSLIAVFAALLVLAHAISILTRGKWQWVFIHLSLIFMLFERNVAYILKLQNANIVNNWLLLLGAFMISIGFSILFRKRKKTFISKSFESETEDETEQGRGFSCEKTNFGSHTVYVDCSDMQPSAVENNFGLTTVYFANTDQFVSGSKISIENNFGETVLCVPNEWRIEKITENSFGAIAVEKRGEEPAEDAPLLCIVAECNFGEIKIKFV